MYNDDKFINLTNYAVQKYATEKSDECMLSYDDFRKYIKSSHSVSEFKRMQSDMESIMNVVTLAGKDSMQSRANTFQVLGWDFMIDHDLRVWLIECNRSPDLMPTTSVTKDLTEELFKDIAKMFCD